LAWQLDLGPVFWFLLWTGLVVAWLVAVVISLFWLWRLVKALFAAVSASADALERLGQTGRFTPATPAPMALEATPEQLVQLRRQLRARRQARQQRRQLAHQATMRQWSVLAGYRDAAP